MYGCLAFFVSMPFRNKTNPETSSKPASKAPKNCRNRDTNVKILENKSNANNSWENLPKSIWKKAQMLQRTSKLRDKEPQTLGDTCRKARGNWVTSRLRFFCQRKWMKHCCLQGSLRVWSWCCSSCLRSWRARDWGDKCREQLGNPPKNLCCSKSHLPQRPPEDEHARLRQEFYISLLWLKASQLTLLKKRPKWTVASSELLCLSLTSKLCWSNLLLMENCGNYVSSVWSLPFSSRIMQENWSKKLYQRS